jgi:hypothetical protein
MKRILLMTLLAAFGASEVQAAGFEAKTGRLPLSVREVERSIILQKGWLELGLGVDWKVAGGYWTADGEKGYWTTDGSADGESTTAWTYSTERIDVRYGLTRRSEIYWRMPFHYMHLTNDNMGDESISTFGLGDPILGYKYEIFGKSAPTTSVVALAQLKVPAGAESPGQYVGGPYTISKFVISTGTPDYTVGLQAKQQAGPVAVLGGVGATYRQSAVAQYIIEVSEYQFSGRIKPGSYTWADLGVQLGLGPLVLLGNMHYINRAETMVGTTGEQFLGNNQLYAVDGSDGWSLDADAGFMVNLTRGLDIQAGVGIPLRGEDLQFFPLETIHPTRGMTYSGTLKLRY